MSKNTQNTKKNLTNLTISDKKKKFLNVLLSKDFNVSETCKEIKISRQTYYDWLNNDNVFSQCVEDIKEVEIDVVESALQELIKAGNPAAIIFYLKTKGRKRGYHESTQLELVKPISEITFDEI